MNKENNIKNKLENIDKNRPFKVPDNYFDNFQSRMADRIASEQVKKQIQPAFSTPKLRLIPVVSVVSILLIIISIVIFVRPWKEITPSGTKLAEIYRYQAIESTSESELINELETLTQEAERKDSVFTKKAVLTEEAIDVLSNDNIDINSIIEAL